MNCGKARERISDYLDGRLSEEHLSEFELHIRGCAECAGELDEMRRMVTALRSLAVPRAPIDLWPQVREGIRTAENLIPIWGIFARPVFMAPVLAVAAAVAVMLILPQPKPLPEKPIKLSASEYRHYLTEHMRFQKRMFVDPEVSFIAVELDRANSRAKDE